MTGAILSLCLTFIGIINRPAGTRLAAVSSKRCAEINKARRSLSMPRMWPTPAWKDAAWGKISTRLFAWGQSSPSSAAAPFPYLGGARIAEEIPLIVLDTFLATSSPSSWAGKGRDKSPSWGSPIPAPPETQQTHPVLPISGTAKKQHEGKGLSEQAATP